MNHGQDADVTQRGSRDWMVSSISIIAERRVKVNSRKGP